MAEEKLNEIFDYYRTKDVSADQNTLIEMLREIQEEEGCIPEDIQMRIEQETGIKKTTLAYLIKMYPSLKSAPYRHRIIVCSGQNCKKKGQKELADYIQKEYKVGKDGISQDGTFRISVQNCLKHCRTSPNISIDGQIMEQVTLEKLKEALRKLQ